MALIRNETKPTVIVGLQNLTRGVYSHNTDNIMVVSSNNPFYNESSETWSLAISVDRAGTMLIPATDSWKHTHFTRIADSVDIVVPGRA